MPRHQPARMDSFKPTARLLIGLLMVALSSFAREGVAHEFDSLDLSQASWLEHEMTEPPGLRFQPYGALWADMIFATQRTNPGAFTTFVPSADDQGEMAFVIDARRTRLGFRVDGPAIAQMEESRTGGRVEIDFHGNFVTENRASVLLRHAYAEVVNPEWRLLIGQTEDVIAPLIPNTINYGVLYAAGNVGFRRAQFRVEHRRELAEGFRALSQASLNQDVVIDFSTEVGVRRESTAWPVAESRLALEWDILPDVPPLALGVSGHVGATQFDFLIEGPPPLNLPPADDEEFLSWSVHADWVFPLAEWARVRGEFFHGSNLASYLGGIGQGVCPCLRVPIRSTGGWMELGWDWTEGWQSNIGIGVDDPRNKDSLTGRIYNQVLYFNVIYNLSRELTTGLEVSHWQTRYHDTRVGQVPPELLTPQAPGESVTINWSVRYAF